MKIMRFTQIFFLVVLAVGCGSGSTQPSVLLTVSTSGDMPTGQSLAGIEITITLPPGVTPALDVFGQVDANYLVKSSGVTSSRGLAAAALNLEAPATQQARMSIAVASKGEAGFGVGEFMVLTLNRSEGAFPEANDFVITEVSAANLDGAVVTGLDATITKVMLL